MAESTEKTVIIRIDLDLDQSTKKSAELNKQIAELNKQQKDLTKANKEGSIEFQRNKEILASLGTELRQNNKLIQDVTKSRQAESGSNEQLRASLSVLTAQYNKLSAEERTNTTQGIEMQKQIATITATLKENESAVGDNRRNVGNYGDALKNLKAELKAAKSEMIAIAAASGTDSKEFQAAAHKAGQLKDQLDDVNASTKAMATGSGIGSFRNQLGLVGQSLKDLDFKEAAERAKGLGQIAKGLDFKETIAGAKAFSVSLYETAVAMFALPITWIVAGIAAIVGGFALASKAASDMAQTQIDAFAKIQERHTALYDGQIKLVNALGMDTEKIELRKLRMQRESVDKQIAILSILQKYNNGLNDDQKKQLDDLRKQQQQNIFDIYTIKIQGYKAQSDASKKAMEEDLKLIKDHAAKRAKEEQDALEAARRLNEQRLADNKKYLAIIQDQEIEMIQNAEDRELAKAALDNARRQKEILDSKADNDVKFKAFLSQQETYEQAVSGIKDKFAKERQADFNKQVADQIKSDKGRIDSVQKSEDEMENINAETNAAILDDYINTLKEEEKAQKEFLASMKRLEQESFSATQKGIDGIAQIRANQREAEIIGIEEETKVKIDNLQAQADAGIITQDEFQTKSNRIKIDAAKQESIIKKKQFEESKKIALIQVAIKTAQGVMTAFNAATPYEIAAYVALALATGALEAAVIQSQPTPAFAEGGKVLSGKRIASGDGRNINRSNGDNILATVKTGEVILNERQQKMLGGSKTFSQIGVPGFASGGVVDGGAFVNGLTSSIDEQVAAINQSTNIAKNLPNPIVLVQDINQVQNATAEVVDRANI